MGIIIWSPEAKADFLGILDYLMRKWGEKAAFDFSDEVDRILDIIASIPDLYPIDDDGLVRKAVIVKQVSLLYSVNGDVIELVRFWDNRQNPAKERY